MSIELSGRGLLPTISDATECGTIPPHALAAPPPGADGTCIALPTRSPAPRGRTGSASPAGPFAPPFGGGKDLHGLPIHSPVLARSPAVCLGADCRDTSSAEELRQAALTWTDLSPRDINYPLQTRSRILG